MGLSKTSYDDLQTTDSASESLKKQAGQFSELAANYGFSFDRRNRAFMPTDGYITKFNQKLPVFADRNFISNSFSSSIYQQFSENVIGAAKFYATTIDGLGGDDVRLSKRKYLSFQKIKRI